MVYNCAAAKVSESKVKELLKRAPGARIANARLKAFSVKRTHWATCRHYAGRLVTVPKELLQEQLRRQFSNICQTSPIRVFFLGTDELQDRSGILQALGSLGELSYFVREDGAYGQNCPVPAAQRRQNNAERLLDMFRQLHREGRTPHLLVAQTWSGYIDPLAFSYVRSTYGTVIVNIAMDDRHQFWGQRVAGKWWGTRGLIPHINLALTAAPECVDWYVKEGCAALFFPEASDPNIFRPMPELPKIHDVLFVGARYGIRERIIAALRDAGVRVATFGSGWQSGRVSTEEAPKLFAQSRIVLGISAIGHCSDFVALKLRDFDGPMSGSCYVTQDNPDLYSLYQVGQEIATYKDIDDCVDKIRYLLKNEAERQAIACAGRARAERDHTWGERFRGLFNVLKGRG